MWVLAFVVLAGIGFGTLVGVGCAIGANACPFVKHKPVTTTDGRTLTGLLADQDTNVVVIRGADGQNISLARDEIEDLRATKLSLMPEGQLKDYTDQQIRDLFAYLRATQPLP